MRSRMLAVALGLCFSLTSQSAYAQTIEDQYRKVARQVPGFAGFSVNGEKASLIVYLTHESTATVEEFREIAEAVFSPADRSVMHLSDIVIRRVSYSWLQLQQWIDVLLAKPIDGVFLTMIDKSTNRLVVGVRDPAAESQRVRDELARRRIPSEAVTISEAGPLAYERSRPSQDPRTTTALVVGCSFFFLSLAVWNYHRKKQGSLKLRQLMSKSMLTLR